MIRLAPTSPSGSPATHAQHSDAHTRRGFGLLAIVVTVLVPVLGGCSEGAVPTNLPDAAFGTSSVIASSVPAPDPAAAKFEQRFLQDMIEHHAMAVEMAMICVENAVHEELRSQCQQIIESQSQEIAMMTEWLQGWYGLTPEVDMTPGMMRQMERLAALSGAEFEIEFMEDMIQHHRTAIVESRVCLRRAYHEELLDLCSEIIEEQAAEIRLFATWLCEWYEVCKPYPLPERIG